MKKVEEISKIVGKTASETYNTVATKSGKLIEDTKLKTQEILKSIQDELGKLADEAIQIEKDYGCFMQDFKGLEY